MGCPSLRHLQLAGLDTISIKWFGALVKALPQIEELDLESTNVGAKHLAHIGGLMSLQKIKLNYCKEIDDNTIANLSQHPSLQDISLTGTAITDQTLASLAQMPCLERAEIVYCRDLTDKGIASLQASQSLRVLSMQGLLLSDQTLEELAVALDLKEVHVPCCPFLTGIGLHALSRHRPNCEVFVEPHKWQIDPVQPLFDAKEDAQGLLFPPAHDELLIQGTGSVRRWGLDGKRRGSIAIKTAEYGKLVSSDALVVGGQNTIATWDWKTQKKGTSFKGSTPASALALSPDGRWLAVARHKLEIIELESDKKRSIPVEKDRICAMAFAPDGEHLWAADGETLLRWTSDGWHPRPAPALPAHALAFSADGMHLYAALETGELLILNAQDGAEIERINRLDQPMVYLMLQTGHGHVIEDIDPSKQRSLPTGWSVQTIAIDENGNLLVLAEPTTDGERHWGGGHMLCCPGVNYRFNAEPGNTECAALSPDGQYLALSGHDSLPHYVYWTRIWSVEQILHRFPAAMA